MIQAHEVDGAKSVMIDHAVTQSCILTGDLLTLLTRIIAGLQIFPDRMLTNLDLTDGLITAEAVMMELATMIGRQQAHEVVHHAAQRVATSQPRIAFAEALSDDPAVTAHLTRSQITRLLDPTRYTGLSADLARQTSRRAATAAARHQ
jgi:3-carboxy-cis,cis-muconate cycloisomerase